MNDQITDWLGSLFGAVPIATIAAVSLEKLFDTIILTAVGAVVSGVLGGIVGFYTSRAMKKRYSKK